MAICRNTAAMDAKTSGHPSQAAGAQKKSQEDDQLKAAKTKSQSKKAKKAPPPQPDRKIRFNSAEQLTKYMCNSIRTTKVR